eukprot:UN24506
MMLLLLGLLSVLTNADYFSKSSGLIELDHENFNDNLEEGLAMVMFYSKWGCPSCDTLKYQYLQAYKDLNPEMDNDKIVMPGYAFDVSNESNSEIVQGLKLRNVPSVVVFTNGTMARTILKQDASDIVNEARLELPSKVKLIKKQKKFKKDEKLKIVLVHKKKKTPDYWKTLGFLFDGYVKFYEARKGDTDKKFYKEYGIKKKRNRQFIYGHRKPRNQLNLKVKNLQ